MAEVMEVTAVAMEAFSTVVQVTVDATEEISADRVTITVASGKEATMEITASELITRTRYSSYLNLHVVDLVKIALQEVAVCLAPLCLELVAPLARLAILVLAAVRASLLAFSWAACGEK